MGSEGKKVPKSVCFTLAAKFMQRYCITGISTILVIYLNKGLGLDENMSTAVFHLNEIITYMFPLFGAILADFIGLYKTITTMCFVSFVGSAVVAVNSIASVNLAILITTLVCLSITFGSLGSIKSNLVTFGADQYQLPEEAESLRFYFSLQMLCIKVASLLGRITTPILREDVKCFGSDSCYAMAFGVPALAMLMGFLIMIGGRRSFIRTPPAGNVFVKLCTSIVHALRMRIKMRKENKKHHWMDHAEERYGSDHVEATKKILRVLVIILPTAIYWSVFFQQGSRWIFQAMRMQTSWGFVDIKPDQMIAMNSVFSILLLPVCTYVLFPLLTRMGLKSIHRITIGGFLGCISFIMAAAVEIFIQKQLMSILWLMPQYAVLALSENFVYITLIEFAYSETPEGKKAVMTALVFVIIALGNVVITLTSGLHLFQSQVYEFIFFASILFADMILFIVLSKNYDSKTVTQD